MHIFIRTEPAVKPLTILPIFYFPFTIFISVTIIFCPFEINSQDSLNYLLFFSDRIYQLLPMFCRCFLPSPEVSWGLLAAQNEIWFYSSLDFETVTYFYKVLCPSPFYMEAIPSSNSPSICITQRNKFILTLGWCLGSGVCI